MLTKKGQSALEYMMTYGWAILIIVIVAVILYSMGIFNPSSSVTFTSSGFSPFIISSSLCNNIGLKIGVNTGPLPGSATSAKITVVYITSATGSVVNTKSYTLSNPITVTPGSVSTIIIPAVTCSANGVKYTVSASLQYTTEGTPLPQTLNSTGTIAGTAISGKPSAITSYVPVTVTNTQSTATPTPFQQMINITSSDNGWSDISTSSFGQNVEFFYYNGSVIPSWLQSYSSTNATWWLKLGSIGGGSSKTIYMGFAPKITNLFNTVNDGEAPQLSSTYAEYDDGAKVFGAGNYFNFTSAENSLFFGANYTLSDGLRWNVQKPSARFFILGGGFHAVDNSSIFEFYYQSTNSLGDHTISSSDGSAIDWVGSSENTSILYPRDYGGWGEQNEYTSYPVNVSNGQILSELLGQAIFFVNNKEILSVDGGLTGTAAQIYFSVVGYSNGYVPYAFFANTSSMGVIPSFSIGTIHLS